MKSVQDEKFVEMMNESLGAQTARLFFDALTTEPSVSVRTNPSKPATLAFEGSLVPWSARGLLLPQRPSFTMDPLFHAGCYYVQDSSAMFVGEVFRRTMPEVKDAPIRVLDLCAAPGGKTTDLAASLRERYGNNFRLVANEVMRQRCSVLNENVALWGDPNVVVTNCDPKAFAQLEDYFDVIVADVPCSGEGMMRKDAQAIADWSPDTVNLCASRQRRIIADVWPALRPGGVLVYSTCTFERAENDDNLSWVCSELGADSLPDGCDFEGVIKTPMGHLLVPGMVPGEGQWAGAVRKHGCCAAAAYRGADPLLRLRPLRNGVCKGEQKGSVLVPDADYALSLSLGDEYPRVELNLSQALHFLHRDTIILPDAPRGYLVVCYQGHPLGFVKNLGTRCNNLHPQGRRILKPIEI